jgi:S-methylmethionine-dependent homocysteine/selenocysteine methylase
MTSISRAGTAATDQLPQLQGRPFLSEGGLETDLIFHHGIDLPDFASFPLLESDDGRRLLTEYFQHVVDLARAHRTGVVLETPTWRASADWGARLGYDASALAAANRRCVDLFVELRAANHDVEVVISGNLGPRGDGYAVVREMTADEAERYHSAQIRTLHEAGADLISAFTINYGAEAIGVVRAARTVGAEVVISFTVETDGALPSGQPLAEAIEQVDRATGGAAAYFMVNCAHPTHFLHVFDQPGPWHRLRGIRANASTMSHAELDEASELDRGDELQLAGGYRTIVDRLPAISVVGGCCGTDLGHLRAIATAIVPVRA